MAIGMTADDFWNTLQAPTSPSNGGMDSGMGFSTQTFAPGEEVRMHAPIDNSGVSGYGTGGTPLPTMPTNGQLPQFDQQLYGDTPGPAPTAGGGGDPEAFRAAWFASPYPKTTDGLKQFVAANPQFGAQITGSKGSKILIGGQAFQAVRSAGLNGGIGPAWDPLGAEGGGGTESNLGSLGYSRLSSMAPWTEQFQAPDPSQIANDPYYQFQLGEGMKSIQGSAAAKGTLLSGGTLKGLEQYGQGLASSFGDKAYDRGMNEYLLRRDNFYGNQDRPFNKNLSLAQLGRPQ